LLRDIPESSESELHPVPLPDSDLCCSRTDVDIPKAAKHHEGKPYELSDPFKRHMARGFYQQLRAICWPASHSIAQ
jgi:hypothetical protein